VYSIFKYLSLFLILIFLTFSYGNQNLNRTSQEVINLDQNNLQTNNFRDESELFNFIESTMATHFIPGLSISIAKGGNIVWNNHFGYANINENTFVDENTMFILSSASKTITATALMHLFQQDLFMLNDDVADYLPFDVNHPDYPEVPITFKMLLSHTSGIKDNWNFMPYYNGDSPLELDYYLNQYFTPGGDFYDSDLNFTDYTPGTSFSYSNNGVALIGLLVEEISGQSFDEYCIDNIFDPLGMHDAYWFLSEIENLNKVAFPHQLAPGLTSSLSVLENYGYSDYPAGQLRTTSNNLAKFMITFMNNGMYNGIEILNPETIEIMKTIHYPNAASDQGLIWYYRYLNEGTVFGHSGGDLGSATDMFISFSNNIGVVILSNSSHGGMSQIGNAVFEYADTTDFTSTGDLNSDDIINNEDIGILINLILAGEYIFMADLNSDNKMDIFDLLHIIESF
jgi:CubicO group peptidase (beta-lactamase class C family)